MNILNWLVAMFSVYFEMLTSGEIEDSAQVTGAVVILAAMFLFGPIKAIIGILVLLVIIAVKNQDISSRINQKLKR